MRSDVVKTLLRTAVWGLCWLLVAGAVWAQTSVPGTPTIDTVTAGSSTSGLTLAVTWTAPTSDGGSTIESYDLRFIKANDDETDDANWIVEEKVWESGGGALSYTISGLTDSTGYDVQVRAVNENGPGAWSATATGTTQDHGDTTSGATSLPLDTPMGGAIDSGDDVDYFTFRLTRETGLLIYTTGDLDTVGELQNSSGTVIDSDDDGPLSSAPLNFFMWQTLAAGTYRIKVSSYGDDTGSYVLRTRTMVDTSSISNAQEITFNSTGNGAAHGLIDPVDDTDYFTFTLSEATEIVIRTTGLVGDTVGTLRKIRDSVGEEINEFIAFNDDGALWPSVLQFLIRPRLDAGTYSIQVEGYNEDDTGWYTLHVNKGNEPGDTRATAVSLDLGVAEGSRIGSSSDQDYFSFVVSEETNIYVGAVSETVNIDGELLDEDGNSVPTILHDVTFDDGPYFFFLHDRLDAGTYYIKVTPSADDDTGPYTIRAFEVASYNNFLAHCDELDDTFNDPLYGCQWHLNNTGQLKGGESDEDINVTEVWDTGTLGAGINVAVVDDGMDYEHEDLRANVNTARNHDYTADEGGDATDIFRPLEDHGTAVAGIIAARDNSLGVRGVAPRATLYGYNLLLDFTDANGADAAQRDLETDVSNNSWGPGDGRGLEAAPGIWEMAVEKGITEGSDDKGIFYVWAAGNGALLGDNSNLDGYTNHYGVTAACAVNDQGKRSTYSEEGANLWVCAPSRDSTRDRHGITTTDNDDLYRDSFGGTSAAAPIVSGVAALVRSANSDLTWRDVKLILAASARQNDADNTGWEDGALQYGSDTETYHFNHEYGFGVVDAEAAVDLVDGWTLVPELTKASADSAPFVGGYMQIPESRTWVTSSITLGSEVEFTEFVEINADFEHQYFRDLQVELVSPAGTVSVLSVPYSVAPGEYHPAVRLFQSFRFGSAKHLGEDPAGTWTLRISDRVPGAVPGRLNAWSLTVYGHRSTPGAPDLASLTPGAGSLTVAWKVPTNTGASDVTAYDVRYIKATEDKTNDDNWTVVDNAWTSGNLQYTISGLSDDVAYDVQVRAVNDQGEGVWSATESETPSSDAPYFPDGTATTRSVDENATAGTHVGSPVAATDPTNETLTYTLSGTDAGSFDINDSTGQLSVASGTALDHETKDRYAVIVTATDPVTTDDPAADSDSITVTITVNDVDESPMLTGQASVEYAENGLLPVATYTATDPEGESLDWDLSGTDSGDFTISNGVLSFNAAPDYEQPADAGGNNVYEVTVEASDGDTSPATLAVTVTVTPVDEVHTLTELSRVASYAENESIPVAEYTVTDPESVSPTWSLVGTDRGDFTMSGGVLRFANIPDYEQPADAGRNNVYAVTVRATAGIHTVEQAVTVRVTGVNEPPTLTGPTSVPPYDENRTVQVARYTATDPEGSTVMWSVTGTDAEDFTITNGVLNFDLAPNYEARDDANGDNDYEVTVVASDGDLTTQQALTVTVNNLDEAGSLTLSSEYPQVETALTAALTEPDCDPSCVSGPTWVWERSTNRSTWTEIDSATSDSYTPVDEDMNNYLRVTVAYTDGHGEPDSKNLQRTSTNRVRAAPGNNNVPGFSDTTTTRSIQENTAAGRNIGDPIVATDLDDDPLTYSLDTTGESVFAIDSRSGQLRTKAELDHENTPNYSVTVTATDPSGDSDSIDVTITIEDEDERLILTGPSTVPYEENSSGIVATFSAADPEEELVTWALAGTDLTAFTLSGGDLTFNAPPDYERDNRYSVTVEATAGSHTARQTVTVSITNVNEAPEITGPTAPDPYMENGTGPVATYRATDPERDPIQWTLEDTDADAFTITDGVLRFPAPPDFEVDDSYVVIVVASDGELTDRLSVTVTVTNADEAGTLTLSSVQPQVDTELTALLDDPDGLVSTDWVWERSQDKRTWEPVKGTPAASYTPETDDVGWYLRVSVVYTDGDGTGSDKNAQVVSPHAVRTAPPTNDPPEFTESPPTLTVGASARAGSRVGAPVMAEDPGDPLTYTLDDTEPSAACFDIDWISGQIEVGPQGLSPCANAATRSPGQRTISAKADEPKTYALTVTATDPSGEFVEFPVFITVSSSPPRPLGPGPGPGPGGGGRGGGGGGSSGGSQDRHGNTAAQATLVPLDRSAPWASSTAGQINPADDIDYFAFTVPQVGVLVVETTGSTDTVGIVWQGGAELASADHGGVRQNFRLSTRVQVGPVVVAVAGNGRQTGDYTLETYLLAGYLENPGPNSFQSGVGVLSGWVCTADEVEIAIGDLPRQGAAYGTERLDTAGVCGDVDNGFGLLFNWNRLEDGEHTVTALVDGIELGRATVTVTTLGQEFLRNVVGECEVEDFPGFGQRVLLEWQQNSQNFVIAGEEAPRGDNAARTGALVGVLENPGPNSFQSGVGVLSGWVCDAEVVEIEIETEQGEVERQVAAYGTERLDTLDMCGDIDNGFGLLFNWNRLRDGEHRVTASVDEVELGRATVRVTTLGQEFLRGVEGECVAEDFPHLGQTVTLEWQQNSQNFVITDVQ